MLLDACHHEKDDGNAKFFLSPVDVQLKLSTIAFNTCDDIIGSNGLIGMGICGGVGEDPRTQSGASASTSDEDESDEGRQRPAYVQRMPEKHEYAHRLRQRESGSRWWTWTSLRLRRRAWLHTLIFLLLASHGAIGQQQENRSVAK